MAGEPLTCPKCGGRFRRDEDQYGAWLSCYMGCVQVDLNPAPRQMSKRMFNRQGEPGFQKGPRLPVTPSNYTPWRERERKEWEQDETVST